MRQQLERPLGRRDLLRLAGATAGVAAASSVGLALPGGIAGDWHHLGPSALAAGSGFAGRVTDLLTGQPIAGATVEIDSIGTSGTDAGGVYQLAAPAGEWPIGARAAGYHALVYSGRTVVAGLVSAADFALIPEALSAEEQAGLYDALGLQVDVPLPESQPQPGDTASIALDLPSTILVRATTSSGTQDTTVPLEDYVKGVVPHEVPYTWPAETLKAQAVAARSYGVAVYRAQGFVYNDTRNQIYAPSVRYPATDAAVDATRSVVVVANGGVASTVFFSTCNGVTTRNSENAIVWQQCKPAGWSYISFCRARACGGHSGDTTHNHCAGEFAGYYGHGVGLCQYGAQARGLEGIGYRDILQRYYTGVDVVALSTPAVPTPVAPANGAFYLPGERMSLAWSATGSSYELELAGTTVSAPNPTYTATAGGLGSYTWRVRAVDGGSGLRSDWSASRAYRVVSTKYRRFFPVTRR